MAVTTEGTGTESVTVDMEVEEGLEDPPATETTQLRTVVGYKAPEEFFLSPNHKRMRVWETFVICTVICTLCVDSFMPAFDTKIITLWVFAYSFDIVFVIDICLRFIIAYMQDGILITDRRLIRRHYLRTTFSVDLFSVLPLDLLVLVSPGLGSAGIIRRLAQYRCINRLFRGHRIYSYFGK